MIYYCLSRNKDLSLPRDGVNEDLLRLIGAEKPDDASQMTVEIRLLH